jgi:hypothetical protein
MKKLILALLGTVIISLSTFVIAGCGSCNSCGGSQACGQPAESECYCTDPNASRNHCMSRAKYCEAFGNVGRGE